MHCRVWFDSICCAIATENSFFFEFAAFKWTNNNNRKISRFSNCIFARQKYNYRLNWIWCLFFLNTCVCIAFKFNLISHSVNKHFPENPKISSEFKFFFFLARFDDSETKLFVCWFSFFFDYLIFIDRENIE